MARGKPEFTYEQIEPLLVFQEVSGSSVYCEFALPGSNDIFESKSAIKRSNGVQQKVKRRMAMVAKNQARRVASRTIRGALGGGALGRMGSVGINTASREVRPGQGPTQSDIEAAIVNAFLRVKENFHYDEETGEWGKPQAAPPPPPKSPFEEQIATNPIADAHDKNIFARVMAELAYSDGQVTSEEAEFFKEMMPPDQPSLDQLAKADPVSRIEAEEVTNGVKGTIYMFAWCIALIDLDLDPVEEELLMEYADVFELQDGKREELIRNAKYFVLEQNIDPDIAREDLFTLAAKVKLDNDDAERCRIAYKRRVG